MDSSSVLHASCSQSRVSPHYVLLTSRNVLAGQSDVRLTIWAIGARQVFGFRGQSLMDALGMAHEGKDWHSVRSYT